MFKKIHRNQKGFTLVEVIVVAVIVAVLAAVAIPLYLGYVNDSRLNSAENAAGSAASFCAACINSGATLAGTGAAGTTMTCSNGTSFAVPAKVKLTLSGLVTGSTVKAEHTDRAGVFSNSYSF